MNILKRRKSDLKKNCRNIWIGNNSLYFSNYRSWTTFGSHIKLVLFVAIRVWYCGISYDALDFASFMAAKCEGSKITILDRVKLPHSLGFFYTAMCQFIGFDNFGEEYKVMGLAPYGNDNYSELMKKLVITSEKIWFKLNTNYFGMHEGGESTAKDQNNKVKMLKLFNDRLINELGSPRIRGEEMSQRDKDIARSIKSDLKKLLYIV